MEFMWPVLLPLENDFIFKGIGALPTEPFLERTAPVPLRTSLPMPVAMHRKSLTR